MKDQEQLMEVMKDIIQQSEEAQDLSLVDIMETLKQRLQSTY